MHPGTAVNVDSKGCGTVMRSAPYGLTPRLADPEAVAGAAIRGSELTHGHPTAGISAAEGALAMSVHCALRHPGPDDMRAALLLAVNHDGDTDSTGAITGNLLGAQHGEAAVPSDWAGQVEGRDTILALADRLAAA